MTSSQAVTRRQRTTELTAAAMSWLWKTRRARMIGMETGFDSYHGPGTAWDRRKRLDVLGVLELPITSRNRKPQVQIWCIEIKSTRADWSRESRDYGEKFNADFAAKVAAWSTPVILCWDERLARIVDADLGEDNAWRAAWPSEDREQLHWVRGRREPAPPILGHETEIAYNAVMSLAVSATAAMMPEHANKDRLYSRMMAELDKPPPPQLDLFLDAVVP